MDTYEKRNLLEKSYQSAVHEAWKQFIANKPIREKDIPPHILRSWKLSREAGMDPLNPQVPPVLNKRELASLCRQHQTLIDSAKPILDMLEVSIRDTGYIAILAVASGHLLAAVGDDNLLVQARSQYNIPGAQRSIKTIGASALSMCIVARAAIQITGYDHDNCWFHESICASAPHVNDNASPIASLTISSHISCKDIHTLTLTTSCANCISIRLRESALIDTEKRLNAMLQRVLNSLPEAVVAIDGNGSITHANNKAANYLLPKNGVLVGKNIDDLFPKPELPRVRQFMRRGVPETGDVTILTHEGERTHFCRFEPIQLSNGDFGMTLSISMKSQIINIANHAGGNYAKYSFDAIRGKSPELKAQIDLARRTARTASRVLLTGESGTGKELFAQAIHNSSSVCKGPFVAVSCAAIPRDLIESELFGYVGGAFTGARKGGMIGKMELAKGGTLFLDEVNSLPLEMQAKLLRALQQMEIVRIGDTKPTPVDVRIIAATNADLSAKMRRGTFRRDLWYRLAVFPLLIPPLRERPGDIPHLVRDFLSAKSRELGMEFRGVVSEKELRRLYAYDWPGNVRELEHVVERSLILHGDEVGPLRFALPDMPPDALPDGEQRELSGESTRSAHRSRSDGAEQLASLLEEKQEQPWPTLRELEDLYIRKALEKTGGRLLGPDGATAILGIHYSTLRARMLNMGLPLPREAQKKAFQN